MKKDNPILFLFGVLFIYFSSSAHLYSSNVNFVSINSKYGISVRETSSICGDDIGFVWSSSKTNILRITEGDYRIYQLPYNTANIGSVKLVYKGRQLYAYASNGQLFLYDDVFDRFDFVVDLRDLVNNTLSINRVDIDNTGALWIASSVGLFRYDNGVLDQVLDELIEIQEVLFDGEDHLFLDTNRGIECLDIKTSQLDCIYEKVNNIRVSRFHYDAVEKRLWMGTFSDGLYYYEVQKKKWNKIAIPNFPVQPILAMVENSETTLLIGIDGKGIWELNKDGSTVLNIYKENADNPFSLRGNGVYDLFCDKNKRLWIATYSGGVSYFDQEPPVTTHITHQINTPNSLGDNNINRILQDKKGNIWVATNNGISRWNVLSDTWETFFRDKQDEAQVFLALCEDNNGNIWAGTYSSGIYILDGKTGRELNHFPQDGNKQDFPSKFIFDIFSDSQGDIWIGGTQTSVLCLLVKENRFRSYPFDNISYFVEIEPGKLLLASSYGLFLLDKKSGEGDYLVEDCITRDIVITGNKIWVATSGHGLVCYDVETRQTKAFTTETGLPSDIVNSIVLYNDYLILTTENGLCKLDLNDESIYIYPFSFALSSLSYNVRSRIQLSNNDIVLGTNNGILIFNPDSLRAKQPSEGKIFFQNITVSGRSIRENPDLLQHIPVNKQTDLYLEYNQNSITLELLPIGIATTGYKYAWIMEALDSEWTQPSTGSTINYPNLPDGRYCLKIRMYDGSYSQIIDERVLRIHITPPFWESWWFRSIMLFITICIIYISLKTYINRLKRKHTEDKVRFFTNMAHDIRTSLTLVNAPIEELKKEQNLSEKGQYYLDLAVEQSNRLSFVSTQLLDFQKVDIGKGQLFLAMIDIVNLVNQRKVLFESIAKKGNIQLVFHSERDSFYTAIDQLKIEKVIDNLISNAVKYSGSDSSVEIKLNFNNEKWRLEVKDYGLGISQKAQKKLFREFYRGDNSVNSKIVGSGIGLLLVKNYVTMHDGTVLVDSKENEGTSVQLSIPYKIVEEGSSIVNIEGLAGKRNVHTETHVDFSISEKESPAGKPRLLLAEDNDELRNFLKNSLSDVYQIVAVNDGKKAWELIQHKAPDLVVSDVMMPDMDGFELCRLMKSSFETSHIPILLLTALSDKVEQLKGLKLGADDYVVKPFDLSILNSKIETIIRNRDLVKNKTLKIISQTTGDNDVLFENELNDKFVKKAIDVIRENMSNNEFGKDDFASKMNVSSSLLYNKIKALTGQSPIDLIKTIRLNYSLELIKSKKYTVTEVSEMCGFSSVSYFGKVFKKYFDKQPTDLLK